ncbi:hypothetical protein [Carboxylicivirga taeanensis]|uniref:hypothetical protein n=1 Tax=Carboxylicivirga taeanensis TaxID=1416875 RepID=UPI003F6DC39D
MLDRLFLKYLSKKGKIAYWVGQLLLDALWAFYLFAIAGLSMEEAESLLFIGIIVVLIAWGGVCILVWKKEQEPV